MNEIKGGSIVWLVTGERGEYSDHTIWTVAVYTDKDKAQRHAKLAMEWIDENKDRIERGEELKNPYDPYFLPYLYYNKYNIEWVGVYLNVDNMLNEHEVLLDRLRELGEVP